MTQTRTFLIFAWLMVATLLWMEWGKEKNAPPPTAPAASANQIANSTNTVPTSTVPAATGATSPSIPDAGKPVSQPPVASAAAPPANGAAQRITLSNDVLRLQLDGGSVRSAELLKYTQTTQPNSPPVRLLDDRAAGYFVAQSGWIARGRAAPTHESGFVPAQPQRDITMPRGQHEASAAFVWTGPDGVSIRRTYTLKRNDYAVLVRDDIVNAGTTPWQGYIYRQLLRDPPPSKSGMTNPEAYSFTGAAWYSPEEKYEKRKYANFVDDGPLDRQVTGGWIALLQHYFFAGWIPQPDQAALYSLKTYGRNFAAEATGPSFTVAPGAQASTQARLWVGPKLQDRLDSVAPGLGLTLDYGIFTFLSKPLHWLLAFFHSFTHNWGWSIVLLVVLIKAALFPLSMAQYKSMAKMRKFQPRIAQLKERYGEDRQKFQTAMMELYKKEKINPIGGCLPVLLQMPVFLALYWVLLESVELRQAPWILWIQDLTARDPYFILPILNMLVTWATQRLTPMVGMDPMQQKMMQFMPLVFGVLFAFFPAGLVLYWVTNGSLGLLQQWWMTRRYADAPAKA